MRIGHLSDTHIDYASGSVFVDGLNFRVKDGFDALTETVDQMLNEEVELVLHSGDLFHKSIPTVAGIVHVREQFLRLHRAGIPVIGITGNHDYPNTVFRKSATLAVSDPDRNITFFDEPYQLVRVGDLAIHALSHGGLVPELVTPEPVAGATNLLLTHGAAEIPGYGQFTCEDSPAEAWVPHTLLTSGWDFVAMGHYHKQHELPLEEAKAWYAGSALRRGFSDEPGERGWLLVDTETGVVARREIQQRSQHDLPVIDASGLNGDEVHDRIVSNLGAVETAGSIIRQKVINCSAAVRKSMPTAGLPTDDAVMWQLRITRPVEDSVDAPLAERRKKVSLDDAWSMFIKEDEAVIDTDKPLVTETGLEILDSLKGQVPS